MLEAALCPRGQAGKLAAAKGVVAVASGFVGVVAIKTQSLVKLSGFSASCNYQGMTPRPCPLVRPSCLVFTPRTVMAGEGFLLEQDNPRERLVATSFLPP